MLMHIDKRINEPVTLTIHPYKEWKTISTGLNAVEGKPFSFIAGDFDELYDCPMLIGNQKEFKFTVDGIPYTFAP